MSDRKKLGLGDVFFVIKIGPEVYGTHPQPPQMLQCITDIFTPAQDPTRDHLTFRHFTFHSAQKYVKGLVETFYPHPDDSPPLSMSVTFLRRWYDISDSSSLYIALRELEICVESGELSMFNAPPCLRIGWRSRPKLQLSCPVSGMRPLVSSLASPLTSNIFGQNADFSVGTIVGSSVDQKEQPQIDEPMTITHFEPAGPEIRNAINGNILNSDEDRRGATDTNTAYIDHSIGFDDEYMEGGTNESNTFNKTDWAQPLQSSAPSASLIPLLSRCLTKALKGQPVLNNEDEEKMKSVFQLIYWKDENKYEELEAKRFPGTLKVLTQIELRLVYRFLVKMTRNPLMIGQCICDLATKQPAEMLMAVCALIRLAAMIKRHIQDHPDFHLPLEPPPGPKDRCPSGDSFGVKCLCEHGNPLSQIPITLLPGLFLLVSCKGNMKHCAFIAASYFSPIIHDSGHPLQGQNFVSVRIFDEDTDRLKVLPPTLQGGSNEGNFAGESDKSDVELRHLLASVQSNSDAQLSSGHSHRAGNSIEPLLNGQSLFTPPLKLTYNAPISHDHDPNSVLLLMEREILLKFASDEIDHYSVIFSVRVTSGPAVHAAVSLPLSPSLVIYDDLGIVDREAQTHTYTYFSRLRDRASVYVDQQNHATPKMPRFLFLSKSILSGGLDHLSMPYQIFQRHTGLQITFGRLIQAIYELSRQTPSSLLDFGVPQPMDDNMSPSLDVMAQQLLELLTDFFCP